MAKYKYLSVLIVPAVTAFSFMATGILTFSPILILFIIIPLLEILIKPDHSNIAAENIEQFKHDKFYDWIIYSMVPIQYSFLIWFLVMPEEDEITQIGRTIAMGLMCGIIGINVGHELGHSTKKINKFLASLLLLSSLENHFKIYHNSGHHRNVGTRKDPATARKNEPLYLFWIRSQFGSYKQAWEIEANRLNVIKKPILSLHNKMIQNTILHVLFLTSIYLIFGVQSLFSFILVAVIGIALLETVNYIEHYGLYRKVNENGTLEHVKPKHSWNSDHIIGRSILFELSRHSDHHYKADTPYQLLRFDERAPQMPTGYPGMMILALVPPLFFIVTNKHVEKIMG